MKIEEIKNYKISVEIMNEVVSITSNKRIENIDDVFNEITNKILVIDISDELNLFEFNEGSLIKFLTLPIIEENKKIIEVIKKEYGPQIEAKYIIREIFRPYKKFVK